MHKGVEAAETVGHVTHTTGYCGDLVSLIQEEIRKQREQEQEAVKTISLHRSLGNIRFIGELYKLKVIVTGVGVVNHCHVCTDSFRVHNA